MVRSLEYFLSFTDQESRGYELRIVNNKSVFTNVWELSFKQDFEKVLKERPLGRCDQVKDSGLGEVRSVETRQ